MPCQMITHTVREGDNFYQLARYYQTTVGEIMSLNPGIDPYNLQVGTRLHICRGDTFNLRYNTTRNNRMPMTVPMDMNRRMMLNNNMRTAWAQHAYWLRMLLNSIASGNADEDAVTDRVLQNPQDIERILARYYPKDVAERIAELIREHLEIGKALIVALRDKRTEDAAELNRRWYANADQLAEALGRSNPYYNTEQLRKMLYDHLAHTSEMVDNRLAGKYAEDIRVFDEMEKEVLKLADYLSQGMMRQFPQEF